MRIPRIHTEQALQPHALVELEAGASRHLASALRMQAGDALVLFDGRGGEYAASIAQVEKRAVSVQIGEYRAVDNESPLAIHLGIGLSRGERMDLVVQKATELGVAAITPLFTERSEVKLKGERAARKLGHWRQIAISACEQCGRNTLPQVHAPLAFGDWLAGSDSQLKLVLHHRAEPLALDSAPRSASLLIGPEGGLSGAEIQAAEAAGFHSLALGPRVLRTETAPLAAIAVLQARWGDISI
ncbi:16S rRNA (uracil(1498)-N(3))-methyltransferase [Haliea sp. E17]|uniref:16S rRNA (uracil(1498)-N(3))-methyltransferase n=1 Tax=Haliea sp. E17 TaxID=3401576 RepID=UPI003AAA9AD1